MDLSDTLKFLIDLSINNNRNWFNNNKHRYIDAKLVFENLIHEVILEIKKIDSDIEISTAKECMFRIYRDARFSANKEPYKTNFGGVIAKGGRKSGNAGYYIHLEPDNSFIGGGIYMPQSAKLKAIRTKIYNNPSQLKSIINKPEFIKTFGNLEGEKLKSAPRGFPNNFTDIELLKHKHFIVTKNVKNQFWTNKNVVKNIVNTFKIQYEFNYYLNED